MFKIFSWTASLGLSLLTSPVTNIPFISQNVGALPNASTVQVPLDTGLVSGVNMPQFGQDYFLGIPYAQPPVGDLRFAAPKPLSSNRSRAIDASHFGKSCLQPPSGSLTLEDLSEDCLSINIIRPAGISSNYSLPVMFWIYGGSFQSGTSSGYNGSAIVAQSVALNESVIFVSINYRVNSLGFLASSELANASLSGTGTLNAGLYDMQLGLQWVQENIGQFGGDKDKVTIFGESAGAIAIGSLLVADNGNAAKSLNLFRAAILESGAPSGDPVPCVETLQPYHDVFAFAAGCASSLVNHTALECLRAASVETIYNATVYTLENTVPAYAFNRVLDGYFHSSTPAAAVRAGNVSSVPIIAGNVLDEGTIFIPEHEVNHTSDVVNLFKGLLYHENDTSLDGLFSQILQLYPDDPALGSPYEPEGTSHADRFFGSSSQYKRAASLFGDSVFQSGRRALLDAYIQKNESYPVYSYLFTQYTNGTEPALGIYHASEIPYVFGAYALQNDAMGQVSRYMLSAWIAFANNLDPNRSYLPTWPNYGSDRKILQIGGGNTTVIIDDYRRQGTDFLSSAAYTNAVSL